MKSLLIKTAFSCVLLFATFDGISQNNFTERKKSFNLKNGVAMSGYDPVSYYNPGKAAIGSESISYNYNGITYYFSSQANRQSFISSPEKYEPQYGGWCAYAMGAEAEKVEVNPETFKITDGKLYLFYNSYFTNTLKSWVKDENNLKASADKNWMRIIKTK